VVIRQIPEGSTPAASLLAGETQIIEEKDGASAPTRSS